MDSSITVNIVEPGSSTVVPDTGLFTHGIGSSEATIIGIVALLTLLTFAIVLITALIVHHKKVKAGKVQNTNDTFVSHLYLKATKHKKSLTASLITLALLVSLGTFASLLQLGASATNSLDISVDNADITIELADEPVFAVLPVEVTVAEATPAGYTLTAYAENTNLVSTADSSSIIPMVTAPEEAELVALEDNTYGLSLVKPESNEEETYTSLSTDSLNPTFITNKDYKETEENDTTTIYYGIYITPDTPYGTYTNSDIYYHAATNSAKVIFKGNGLYFNNNLEQTTNDVEYLTGTTDKTAKYSHTSNINDEGIRDGIVGYHGGDILNKVVTIPGAAKIKVQLSYGGGYISGGYPAGYLSFWQGSHPDYTTNNNLDTAVKSCGDSDVNDGKFYGDRNNENAIITVECELQDNSATFAYWTSGGGPSSGAIYGYYAIVTGYDENGNIIYLNGNTPKKGEYKEPAQDLPYIFLGWSEDKDAAAATYESKNDIERDLPLTNGETTELYAIWQYATNITFDGNGADGGVGLPDRLVAAGQSTSLGNYNSNMGYQTAYTRTGYAFNGWNTKADGAGTAYPEYSGFSVATDRSENITLYAQWTPATTIIFNSNGGEGSKGNQTIRAGETSSIYGNWGGFFKDGYVWAYWTTEPDGSGTTYYDGQEFTASDQSQTITLYAQWAEEGTNTTIIYEANGGEGWMGSQTIWAGNTDQIWGSNYWWNGHDFIGWNTEPDGTGTPYEAYEYYAASNVTKTITLYAQWEEQAHTTFIFDGNGADSGEMSDQTIYAWQGDNIWCGSDYYQRDGYYFVNWNTDPYGNGTQYDCGQWYEASDQSETITLYAQWAPATTFVFDGNGADGGQMPNQNIPAGQGNSIWCANGNYSKDGYYSFGWDTDPEGNGTPYDCGQWYEASDQSETITLYAQWAPATTIIFDSNGADWGWMDNETIPAGDTWDLWNNSYHKESYYFAGWNTESDGTGEPYNNLQSFTASDESQVITLYAQWEEQKYTTITFDGNGADWGDMSSQSILAGYTEELLGNEYHKEDYLFNGWNTEYDGTGTPYNNYQSITASDESVAITLYAQWILKEEAYYTTITFDGNGADWGDMQGQIVAADQAIRFSWNEYGKDGYSFSGWNTESDGTGISYTDNDLYTAINGDFANVTLYAQWEEYCGYNNICYKSNGADGETFMDNQQANSYESTTLYPSNFSYSGHGFAGWSKDQNAAAKLTDNDPDNNPTIYGPNQTIFTENMNNGMNLYAVWLEPAKDINNDPLTFQTENLLTTTLSDNTTLASKSNGYVTALKDERDNQVYAVAKLADGNYWMIENLRLDNTAEITPENTNNPRTDYITGPGSDRVVRIKNNDGVYYDHLSPNNDNWCTDTSTNCIDQSYLNTDNVTSPEQQSYPEGNTYSYGNYYNWYSATAGNGTYNTAYRNVGGDLCPSGWQLPVGGEANEPGSFPHLGGMLDGSDGLRSFPNNFVYSGYWYGSEVNNRGYSGSYWSSTALYTNSAYGLILSDYLSIEYSDKFYGYAVRCVAQATTTIIYNGNGADSGEIPNQKIVAGETAQLSWNYGYSRTGYIFAGWNTESDGSGIRYDAGSDFTAPSGTQVITLYAQWEEATTIIFNGNGNTGGRGMTNSYLTSGQTIKLCGGYTTSYYAYEYYYTKTNHKFTGWNTEPDGSGTSYADCAEFTAPAEPVTITLYAQWQPYTRISFNSNGGEGNRSDENIEPGGSRELCNYNYFTKTGYYFYGWNTESDGSGTSYSDCEQFTAPTPSVDITLYAQWEEATKIIFDGNGADYYDGGLGDIDLAPGSTTQICNNLWGTYYHYTKDNYEFAGWNTEPDGSGTSYADCAEFTAPAEPVTITLYAQWKPFTRVIFDGNGGEGNKEDLLLKSGQSRTLCNNDYYAKTGNYVYAWNTESDGSGTSYAECAEFTAPAEPVTITLYAQWKPFTRVVFDGNGGEGNKEDLLLKSGQSGTLCNNDSYTRAGYAFTSWNTEPDGSSNGFSNCSAFSAPSEPVTIILYAQWAKASYIHYNSNGADGETSMGIQEIISNSYTLWASNFSYTNHGFAGWSEDQDAAAKLMDNNPDNDPVIYGPNETISLGYPDVEDIYLYAVWLSPATDENEQELTFQTENLLTTTLSDGTTLASKNNGYVTALKDSRDNEVYAVAKLADGNYWMIENLRLDNGPELTSQNTNNPASTFTRLPTSSSSWCGGNNDQCINTMELNTNNTTASVSVMTNEHSNVYSYGNYYNWRSATAGNGSYSTGKDGEETISGDICPAGWQLPIGGNEPNSSGSFSHLDVAMGGTGENQRDSEASNRWRSFPNNFVYADIYWRFSVSSARGDEAHYWSSTASDTNFVRDLSFRDYFVNPGGGTRGKNGGLPIRCVASSNFAKSATTTTYSSNSTLNQGDSSRGYSAYSEEDTETVDSSNTDTTTAPPKEDPLGEYQSTTSTEDTDISIPILAATSALLGASALVLLAYSKSRQQEDE